MDIAATAGSGCDAQRLVTVPKTKASARPAWMGKHAPQRGPRIQFLDSQRVRPAAARDGTYGDDSATVRTPARVVR
jgi:hypothetical protein